MTQTNEELREKIQNKVRQILLSAGRRGITLGSYVEGYTKEIMSLIPQSEQTIWPESNYMSLVNGSGTHCKECGKRL